MPGDPWATAQANVALKYDPQQSAIDRAIADSQAGTVANEQALQGYGTTGRGVIGDTFGTLYGLLGQNRQQQQADLGRQVNLTNQGYDEAYSNIQQQGTTSSNYLNEMARALGQEGAGYKASSELADIINTSLGRTDTAKARYGGNLADWAAKMDVFSGQGIDQAHQSESLRRGEFETQLLKLLGQNKLEGQQNVNDLTGQLSDILGARQSDLLVMYQQLAQQEWENAFKQAQLDQQAAEASAALANARDIAAMQESGANSRASAGRDDSLGWAQLQAEIADKEANRGLSREEMALKYAAQKPEGMSQKDWASLLASDPSYMTGGTRGPVGLAADSAAFARGDFSAWAPEQEPAKTPSKGFSFKGGLKSVGSGAADFGLGFGQAVGSPASALYSWLR